jgi:F-type H+-transporting ATPase subunit delta
MLSVVAHRYAKALADVVTGPKSGVDAPRALRELREVEQIIAASSDLHNALLSPAVTPSKKRAVMARLVQSMGMARQVLNFVYVVIDHRRVHEFSSIIDAFEMQLDERLGYVQADVSSARELTEAEREGLETELSRLAGKKAKLKFTTNPALIAGVMARVGSTVYDGSVRGQMERLRAKLASA